MCGFTIAQVFNLKTLLWKHFFKKNKEMKPSFSNTNNYGEYGTKDSWGKRGERRSLEPSEKGFALKENSLAWLGNYQQWPASPPRTTTVLPPAVSPATATLPAANGMWEFLNQRLKNKLKSPTLADSLSSRPGLGSTYASWSSCKAMLGRLVTILYSHHEESFIQAHLFSLQ